MTNNGSALRSLLLVILHKICVYFLSILLVIFVIPIATIIFLPIYGFRLIICKLCPILRPDLGKILSTGSTLFSLDELGIPNPPYLIVSVKTLEGTPSIQALEQAISERCLKLMLPTGELRYPELKQYPVNWMGFKFWKNVDNFDIRNHVQLYESKGLISETELEKVRQEALEKAFPKCQSPWSFLVVNNYFPKGTSEPHSLCIMRAHHSIGDGYAFMKFVIEGLYGEPIIIDDPNVEKIDRKVEETRFVNRMRRIVKRLRFFATFPIRCVFEFSEMILNSLKSVPWDVPVSKRTYSVHAVTNKISMAGLKRFKSSMGVSFNTVIHSACAGAIKTAMDRKGILLPDYIPAVLPFPKPNHPLKLRNHLTQVIINLPIGAAKSSEERLKLLDASYKKIVRSVSPALNAFLSAVAGGLFSPLTKVLSASLIPPVLISTFPSPWNSSYMSFQGHRDTDFYFYCGLLNMPAISFFQSSFDETIRIAVVAESSILTADEVRQLVDHVEKELLLNVNLGDV